MGLAWFFCHFYNFESNSNESSCIVWHSFSFSSCIMASYYNNGIELIKHAGSKCFFYSAKANACVLLAFFREHKALHEIYRHKAVHPRTHCGVSTGGSNKYACNDSNKPAYTSLHNVKSCKSIT